MFAPALNLELIEWCNTQPSSNYNCSQDAAPDHSTPTENRGPAPIEGMVGTYIEGADGKMRPALCGGRDTRFKDLILRDAGSQLCSKIKTDIVLALFYRAIQMIKIKAPSQHSIDPLY